MADITIRHGGGAHFMRPDRVYATGVLSPMTGYQPQHDVNAVTREFTQGPTLGLQLQGLGAMPGPIARWWFNLKARIAARRAQRLMQTPAAPPPFVPTGPSPAQGVQGMPGPAHAMAAQISPHLATQMTGVVALMQSSYGDAYPGVAAEALVYRPLGQWYR